MLSVSRQTLSYTRIKRKRESEWKQLTVEGQMKRLAVAGHGALETLADVHSRSRVRISAAVIRNEDPELKQQTRGPAPLKAGPVTPITHMWEQKTNIPSGRNYDRQEEGNG